MCGRIMPPLESEQEEVLCQRMEAEAVAILRLCNCLAAGADGCTSMHGEHSARYVSWFVAGVLIDEISTISLLSKPCLYDV